MVPLLLQHQQHKHLGFFNRLNGGHIQTYIPLIHFTFCHNPLDRSLKCLYNRFVAFDKEVRELLETMKTKFVCVKPKSRKAKNRFANLMNDLHSCRIQQEDNQKMFLESISGNYFFWMLKENDSNWEVIK